MDSIEKRNSITYDAEKDELKIITYYDERRYKEIWVRDLQIGFLKYMMQTWDLKIRNSWLAIILALWGVYWLIIIGVTLYVLVLFLRSPSFGFILIFAFLIYLWFSAITFRKYWLKKGIQAAQSDDFFKAKKLGPTMAAIEYAFEKQPVFRQELTITATGIRQPCHIPMRLSSAASMGNRIFGRFGIKTTCFFCSWDSLKGHTRIIPSRTSIL